MVSADEDIDQNRQVIEHRHHHKHFIVDKGPNQPPASQKCIFMEIYFDRSKGLSQPLLSSRRNLPSAPTVRLSARRIPSVSFRRSDYCLQQPFPPRK